MDELQSKAKVNSFYIALTYVGLGTVSLFAITSSILMENDFISILFMLSLLLTMPVSFLGFGVLYGGGQYATLVALLIQVVVFLLFWYLTYRQLLGRYMKKLLGQEKKRQLIEKSIMEEANTGVE